MDLAGSFAKEPLNRCSVHMIRKTAEKRLKLVNQTRYEEGGIAREWDSQGNSTVCLYLITLKRGESMRQEVDGP